MNICMRFICKTKDPTPKKKTKNNKKDFDPNFDKEKAKLAQFDPRGVQTLFRTLSRNYYNLLRMIDSKASIVLTVGRYFLTGLIGSIIYSIWTMGS